MPRAFEPLVSDAARTHPLFSQVVHISPAAVEVVYREGGAEGATAVRQHIASGRLMSFQAWLESIGAGPNPAAHRSRKK